MVVTSLGNLASMTKTTGHCRDSPGASVYWLKQKHSVLWKYSAARAGEMLGIAWATIAVGACAPRCKQERQVGGVDEAILIDVFRHIRRRHGCKRGGSIESTRTEVDIGAWRAKVARGRQEIVAHFVACE